MADELFAFVAAACAVFSAWGGVLCFRCCRDSSAPLHMFDESGPTQSKREEDVQSHTPVSAKAHPFSN